MYTGSLKNSRLWIRQPRSRKQMRHDEVGEFENCPAGISGSFQGPEASKDNAVHKL